MSLSLRSMQTDPRPPLLLIQENVAFGLEESPVSEWSATPQAFAAGCFRDSFCLDEAGNAWRIMHARLRSQPNRLNQWMPWRRIPVEVTLSSLPKMSAGEVVAHLIKILETENEFCESLGNQAALEDAKRRLSGCTSLPEVFQLVGRYVRD